MIPPRAARTARPLLFLVLLTSAPYGDARGQGLGSPLVPGGRLRIQVVPGYASFDQRFGSSTADGSVVEGSEPLGFDLSVDRVGTGLYPSLFPDEALLATAVEDPAFELSLGSTRALLNASSTRLAVGLDLGVTDWLTLGATVPLVRRRVEARFLLSRQGANVGVSPQVLDALGTQQYLDEFQTALTAAQTEVDALCAAQGEQSPVCQDARAMLQTADGTFQGLAAAYLGSDFFVLEGSAAGQALSDRIAEIQGAFSSLGVGTFTAPPPLATEILDDDDFAGRFVAPVHGSTGLPLEGGQSLWELGDVEFSAALRLLQLVSRDSVRGRPGFRLQLAGGATLRLGTASEDTLRTFLDLDSQRGTTDLELLAHADVQWLRKRMGARVDLRYGLRGGRELLRRIAPPGAVLDPGYPTGLVDWAPGDERELVVAPRILLTPELALAGRYGWYDRGRATFRLVSSGAGGTPSDPSVLAAETEATVHTAGVTLLFSTLEAHRLGRTGFPFELQARWETAVAGSGGRTPAGSRFQASLRLYVDLWGG